MKVNVKVGNYKNADDVEIEIVRTIPQIPVEEVNVYSVRRIKKEIVECGDKIALLTARKTDLESVLMDNENAIINSIQ